MNWLLLATLFSQIVGIMWKLRISPHRAVCYCKKKVKKRFSTLIRHWHMWENHRKHNKSNRVRTVKRCCVAIVKTGSTSFPCQLLPVLHRYSYNSAQWSSPCLLFPCYFSWPCDLQRCRNVLKSLTLSKVSVLFTIQPHWAPRNKSTTPS